MKKLLLTLSLAFCLIPSFASAQVGNWLADTLQATLNKRAKALNVKSAAASVAFPDGSVWQGAYGMCGGEPTSPDFLFEMGSNTKTYVSAMILQLADEGKLKLDDTIYKFLPVNPNIAYGITIRQMLNHTSGIFNYTEHPLFADFVNGDPDRIIDMDTMLEKWIDPMIFSPGTNWSYSNTNYALLGRIIAKLDGMPFEQSLRKRILDPFGFKETFLDVYEQYSLTKAGSWLSNGAYLENFPSFMSSAWAAGAIVTTPDDLARWAWALYHGNILPNHWLDSMKVTVSTGGSSQYGLGMFQRSYGGRTYIGHGGTTLQNSEMEYSVSSDFSVVTVVNEQGKGAQAGALQNNLIALVEKVLPKALSVSSLEKYSFRYYPNPVTDHFTLSLEPEFLVKHPTAYLKVYALSGVMVKSVELDQAQMTIQRDNLVTGLYLMEISDDKGYVVFRDKLILQ